MNQFTLVVGEMSYLLLWDHHPQSWRALLRHIKALADDPEEVLDHAIAAWVSKIILLRVQMQIIEGKFSCGDALGILE